MNTHAPPQTMHKALIELVNSLEHSTPQQLKTMAQACSECGKDPIVPPFRRIIWQSLANFLHSINR